MGTKAHLFIFRGLPASGKSSISQSMLDAGLLDVVVTRDDIRQEIKPGRKFVDRDLQSDADREFERIVLERRNTLITRALCAGMRVACADTNLSGTALRELHTLAGNNCAEVTIITVDTPHCICIERDSARVRPVGAKTIQRMSRDWHWQRR